VVKSLLSWVRETKFVWVSVSWLPVRLIRAATGTDLAGLEPFDAVRTVVNLTYLCRAWVMLLQKI
jgi:hypothetical protein